MRDFFPPGLKAHLASNIQAEDMFAHRDLSLTIDPPAGENQYQHNVIMTEWKPGFSQGLLSS